VAPITRLSVIETPDAFICAFSVPAIRNLWIVAPLAFLEI
jgi:hypothetical protein